MSYEKSVSTWLTLLSDGDERAIETAFDRYFTRLTRLATSKMTGLNQAVRSGEDVALSAFRSFFSGIKARRLVVDEESDLWACLFRIVTRKACAERRREFASKRGGALRASSVQTDDDGEDVDILAEVAGREPSPDIACEMASRADEILRLFEDNPKRRRIVELKLLGADDSEIAQELLLTKRTVCWHLSKIRERVEFVTSAELLLDELFFGASLDVASEKAGWTIEHAKRVLDEALTLWRQESNVTPAFLAESDSPKSDADDDGKTLDIWKRRVRDSWIDPLLEAFTSASDSFEQ